MNILFRFLAIMCLETYHYESFHIHSHDCHDHDSIEKTISILRHAHNDEPTAHGHEMDEK